MNAIESLPRYSLVLRPCSLLRLRLVHPRAHPRGRQRLRPRPRGRQPGQEQRPGQCRGGDGILNRGCGRTGRGKDVSYFRNEIASL